MGLWAIALSVSLAACQGPSGASPAGSAAAPTGNAPSGSAAASAGPSALTGEGAFADGDRVTLVVPYSAGGGFDAYARTAQPCIETALREVTGSDVSVVVENVTGAGGRVGTEQVFRSPADGTQMIINTVDQMASQQVLDGAEFDATTFTPIGQLAYYTYSLVARKNLLEGDWDVNDLIERSQQQPILWGGTGLETQGKLILHLLGEGGHPAKADFVSFDGTGDAVAAMLRNELEVYLVSTPTALQTVEANPDELRVLVNIGPRYDVAQDVPTLEDAGISNAAEIANGVGVGNRALFGPPDMDANAAAALQEALRVATGADQECVTKSAEGGYPVTYASPQELAALVGPIVSIYEDNKDVLSQ